ncbi:unnamed protein product [Staurois parvus]|uniref:Uncharacterized protein n=1 Tax=Staurois parvus TaxID=386267 RepID=A0ABN9B2K2_9NEOB|nr:unnamed protein product [Staurois parvus]CAI9553689.1 unnamed protein product [Staurois parvus]
MIRQAEPSGCQLIDQPRAWGLSPGCAFTRAPDGGDGLETVPGQVTTSGRAHQRLGRPPGMRVGTGRARYEADDGPSRVARIVVPWGQGGTDSGSVGGKRGTKSAGKE